MNEKCCARYYELEEIMEKVADLRDEHLDVEMVIEYHGHDITTEIASCPKSALSYTGDYIELLQKRVQELESRLAFEQGVTSNLQSKNKRYREALEFYASDETWKIDETNYSDADKYKGKVAHEALEGEE